LRTLLKELLSLIRRLLDKRGRTTRVQNERRPITRSVTLSDDEAREFRSKPSMHFQKLGEALQLAVDAAFDDEEERWATDGELTAAVAFEVVFKKVNPGQIGEYKATIS
jgi:hypothetical protein